MKHVIPDVLIHSKLPLISFLHRNLYLIWVHEQLLHIYYLIKISIDYIQINQCLLKELLLQNQNNRNTDNQSLIWRTFDFFDSSIRQNWFPNTDTLPFSQLNGTEKGIAKYFSIHRLYQPTSEQINSNKPFKHIKW